MQEEYEDDLEGKTDLDKRIIKLSNLNQLAYEDLILLVNASSAVRNAVFGLIQNKIIDSSRVTAS